MIIKKDLSKNLTRIDIHALADWHISDPFCSLTAIKELVKAIEDDPNAFCILNGDIINNATKMSVSDIYKEVFTPRTSIDVVVDILKPIKHKVIAIIDGNHEKRSKKDVDISPTELIASKLGLEHLYCPISAYIYLRFGCNEKKRKICYTIYAKHGVGGGKKEGGKVNQAVAMSESVGADIYIHSHTHLPFTTKTGFMMPDYQNSSLYQVTRLFVNTASMLEYGGYGEQFGFKPSVKDNPVIHLEGRFKKSTATL